MIGAAKRMQRYGGKNLVDTINKTNTVLDLTENFWEHRSFKERGLDVIPEIHLGEKAAAMERAGIHTIRGDINRDIREKNIAIKIARATYDEAVEKLEKIRMLPGKVVENIKNEILDMIREIARRNKDRLKLPIVTGKYLRLISNRSELQSKERMENFIAENHLSTFAELKEFKEGYVAKHDASWQELTDMNERISYLRNLLRIYDEDYSPYIKFNKEYWAQDGYWAKRQYKKAHTGELMHYEVYRDLLKGKIQESVKKITAKAWRTELTELEQKLEGIRETFRDSTIKLASCEVIEWNKKDLERVISNESKERTKTDRKISRQK